jgi:hypothetical protein
MVTRNPNWSIKIRWYETNYGKKKILSPLKRHTQSRQHYWFYLKLLRVCWFKLWWYACNISNSSVNEYSTTNISMFIVWFKNIFKLIFFIFSSPGLGPTEPVQLVWTQPTQPSHLLKLGTRLCSRRAWQRTPACMARLDPTSSTWPFT